nr:hypothetical protein [uncultured bacterium]
MTMKTGIAVLFILLTAIVADAGEQPGAELVALPTIQEIEHQLVQAGIQPEEATSILQAMRRARFTEEQMLRVGEQLTSGSGPADAVGPVLAKVHEGIAKGIPPESILAATVRVRDRYRLATSLALRLTPTRDDQLTATLADCLAAGLTEQEAMRIASSLRTRTQDMDDPQARSLMIQTLLTARTMARQKVSSGTTAVLISNALARGYGSEEMQTLRHAVESSGSADMEATAKRFGAAIGRGASLGQLQSGLDEGSGSRGETGGGSSSGGGSGNSGGADGNDNGSGSGSSGGGSSGGGSGSSGGGSSGGGSGGNGNGSGGSGSGGGGGRS